MKHSDALVRKVKGALKDGMTVDEAVVKFKVSKYFVKMWKCEVFDGYNAMIDISKKYQFIVDDVEKEAEIEIGKVMRPEEAEAISDETWEQMSKAMKKVMFRLANEIEKVK